MRIDDSNIEDVLIRAIQEKAALDRVEAIDSQMDAKLATTRHLRVRMASIAAACVVLVACGDVGLRLHTRSVGYSYDLTEFSRSGSAIESNIANRRYKEALEGIDAQRNNILNEMTSPSYDDPDYLDKLATDLEELSFTQAVCHLRQGKYFKARKELKEIVGQSSAFSKEAGELLDNML